MSGRVVSGVQDSLRRRVRREGPRATEADDSEQLKSSFKEVSRERSRD